MRVLNTPPQRGRRRRGIVDEDQAHAVAPVGGQHGTQARMRQLFRRVVHDDHSETNRFAARSCRRETRDRFHLALSSALGKLCRCVHAVRLGRTGRSTPKRQVEDARDLREEKVLLRVLRNLPLTHGRYERRGLVDLQCCGRLALVDARSENVRRNDLHGGRTLYQGEL